MPRITITTPYIRLEAAIKLAAIAGSGGVAKQLILDACVQVNGEIETRRGRKLYPGDHVLVHVEENEYSFSVEAPL
jgi:ribosome-associated protein